MHIIRKTISLLCIIYLTTNISYAQDKIFKSNDFNWKINIPNDLNIIDSKVWLDIRNKENNEKGYLIENEDNSKIILILKKDSLNYFIANHDKDLETSKTLQYDQKIMFAISRNYKNVKANRSNETVKIGRITFQCSKTQYILSNSESIYTETYGSLIKNKIFTVFIIYNNEKDGKQIVDNWRNSIFK